MEEHLKTLVNILASKYSTILKTSSTDSNWVMHFPVPLELDPQFNYELGLMFFSVYNTISNINDTNNILKYKDTEEQRQWNFFKITPRAYELRNLDTYLRDVLGDKLRLETQQ